MRQERFKYIGVIVDRFFLLSFLFRSWLLRVVPWVGTEQTDQPVPPCCVENCPDLLHLGKLDLIALNLASKVEN